MKVASKPSAKRLASVQAKKLSNSAKKAGWSARKVSRRSSLFSFADAKSIRVLSWPEL